MNHYGVKAPEKFNRGDVVLAKCKGYPDWPGSVIATYSDTIKKVNLFESKCFAYIECKDMTHLTMELLHQVRNKSDLKNYQKAIELAMKKLEPKAAKKAVKTRVKAKQQEMEVEEESVEEL